MPSLRQISIAALFITLISLLSGVTAPSICAAPNLEREPYPIQEQVEWRTLNAHQHSLTEEELRQRLEIFSPDGTIYQFLTFHENSVDIFETPDKKSFLWRLYFKPTTPTENPRPSETSFSPERIAVFYAASWDQPLKGLRIAIDPGHIGGKWANIEERYFKYKSYAPVQEGDLTMQTAELLAERLEAAGATVILTRTKSEPLTRYRPEDFLYPALEWAAEGKRYFSSRYYRFRYRWYSELLFYRVSEIFARGKWLETHYPDFTICIHYNAAPWPGRYPRLYRAQKLVAFVHGSYLEDEIRHPVQKFALFKKLFEHSSPMEIEIADAITREMQAVMKMRPENYGNWKAADRVSDNPYIWSRNIVANRVFPGPVIFAEGPYMNDYDTFYRIQAGDYDGVKTIRGKQLPSMFREFADAMAGGLIKHYRKKRNLNAPNQATIPKSPQETTGSL